MELRSSRILGILGGRDVPLELLAAWAATADLRIAADSGADLLLAAGHQPDVILGDMDSLSGHALALSIPILADMDQETTDADKLCTYVSQLGHEGVTLIGVEGDMYDHVLGILRTSVSSPLSIRLALRQGVATIVRPGQPLSLAAQPGQRISLLGLHDFFVNSFIGVKWPLSETELHFSGLQSISNEAVADRVELQVSRGVGLLIASYAPDAMPIWPE